MIKRGGRKAKNVRVACIQVSADSSAVKNLDRYGKYISQALSLNPDIIAFPENFAWRGASSQLSEVALLTPEILKYFQLLARQHKTSFLLGSLIESSKRKNLFYNTAYWISKEGKMAARYRKIHLFDVLLPGKKRICESEHLLPGKKVLCVSEKKVQAGVSICYDLRFPELYRKLSFGGAKILFVPANFTEETGRDHWEVLLRARAIENQCFVVAPAQCGTNSANKVKSYGHSLIIDPWGRVLAEATGHREEVLWADLDLEFLSRLRRSFPVLQHRRLRF